MSGLHRSNSRLAGHFDRSFLDANISWYFPYSPPVSLNAFCSITLFVRAKKYLARHRDWRPAVHYFEPWSKLKIASLHAGVYYFLWKGDVCAQAKKIVGFISKFISKFISNVCGNKKRGCQWVSLFAVSPPHHNKSCYLYSWYKLPRPIQACHKRAWEVHQPKEGDSTNAEVTCCHFLYSSNYDTSLSYLLSSAYQSPLWKYHIYFIEWKQKYKGKLEII